MNKVLKQRIVGAIVLCALAIVFLPAFFTMPTRPDVKRLSDIPQPPPVQTVSIASAQPLLDDSVKPLNLKNMHIAKAEQDGNVPVDAVGRWVIQVVSYKTRAEADKFVSKIVRETDLVSFVRTLVIDGEVNRVYVGPFLTRQDALDAKRQVDQKYRVQSLIMSLPNSKVESTAE